VRWPSPALRFRTKLALAILFLFFLTVALLFAVDTYNERRLIDNLESTTEAVTKAIEVASDQAQLSPTGAIDTEILQDYAEKLRRRGVREIQILNPERTVIASSKPRSARLRGRGKPRDISITGTISEDSAAPGPKHEYRLVMPIISQNQKVGYVTVSVLLDDYDAILSQNFGRRVIAVASVFGVGLVLVLVLTRNFTQPIGQLTAAARRVADGELDARVPEQREDDLGDLVTTWNAMVDRLREQRRLEARLAAAERQASLAHLVSGLAHEIRNPLNTIALAVDYLRRRFSPADPAGNEEFARTAESLREEIARLNSLITNFLNYGKPLPIRPTSLDALELARSVAAEVRPESELRGVEVTVDLGPPVPVRADRDLLKSAFLNVALNAIQHMTGGGRLRVSVRAEPERWILRFDDDGPGIPRENLERIFEPYFSTRDGGVGLGLAMTRRILLDHGGDVRATNREEGGTRFEFLLPSLSPLERTA
jgi:signal transduction histidine kinase